MKSLRLPLFIIVLMVASAVVGMSLPEKIVPNPDPNHTHADFAVWVNGQKLDFAKQIYMSEEYHEGEDLVPLANELRKYLHLHDGIGHVLHRHKPGLTIGEFFASLGLPMTGICLTLDDVQYTTLDKGWKESFGITKELCANGKFRWTMALNDLVVPMNPGYVPNDLDKIMLSYGASDTAWQEEWKEMSDDSCLYSKTCPGRGKPPTENCIADPSVPCVIPE